MDFPNIPFDEIMKQMKNMPGLIKKKQAEMQNVFEEGMAGYNGMSVKITMNGLYEVTKVYIDDNVLKEPKEVLSDLFISACHAAKQKIDERNKKAFTNPFSDSNT